MSAHVAPNLFLVTATSEVANAHCCPAEFSHQGRKVTVCAGGALALWYLEDIQQDLRADALQAIKACLAAHALQSEAQRALP